MTEYTAGAMRAAKCIWGDPNSGTQYAPTPDAIERAATAISRETGDIALREALENIAGHECYDRNCQCRACQQSRIAEAALKLAKGKP